MGEGKEAKLLWHGQAQPTELNLSRTAATAGPSARARYKDSLCSPRDWQEASASQPPASQPAAPEKENVPRCVVSGDSGYDIISCAETAYHALPIM